MQRNTTPIRIKTAHIHSISWQAMSRFLFIFPTHASNQLLYIRVLIAAYFLSTMESLCSPHNFSFEHSFVHNASNARSYIWATSKVYSRYVFSIRTKWIQWKFKIQTSNSNASNDAYPLECPLMFYVILTCPILDP